MAFDHVCPEKIRCRGRRDRPVGDQDGYAADFGYVQLLSPHNRDKEYVRTALAVDADQIVPNLARPVSNSDRLGIENVVESMMLDPALKGVVVKSADNQTVLCARERDGQGKVTEARGEDCWPSGSLVEKREVKFDDQTLATVTLFGTTKPVQDRTERHW